MQQQIFGVTEGSEKLKKGGPENRMNDLSYKEWMKYQKSFFDLTNDDDVFSKSVSFFTKEVWKDGRNSNSLIIGLDNLAINNLKGKRKITFLKGSVSFEKILNDLEKLKKIGSRYDFILIDLRETLSNTKDLKEFLTAYSTKFFTSIKALLNEDCYTQILIEHANTNGTGFPIAWSVAQSARIHLRVRDEKVGLDRDSGKIQYFLFFQNSSDLNFNYNIDPSSFSIAKTNISIPNFIIPRTPPRKKNEILHPAKFPEALVTEFIQLFSRKGENIFDPMVGTGSTIIAANRIGRSGYGVDLNAEFIKISNQRITSENAPKLFDDENNITSISLQGDATKLEEIEELADVQFDYVVTSPPYWSMLNNPGSENQRNRKKKGLSLVYSTDDNDLGNIEDYAKFLEMLSIVYNSVSKKLKPKAKITIIVKNVKRNHILYSLAWDLTDILCGSKGAYSYIGTTFWCQDDIGLKPFAVGTHWVSNILHQYCLHFEKR